jgi:maleylacetoacetate isomerase
MLLYDYFRSSAAYRVRIALGMKGIAAERVSVHLLKNGGEQHGSAYRAVNPMGLVPALVSPQGMVLTQSLAIIEYLEETVPSPPLLPADPEGRARARAMALLIACDIHPLNNLRVLAHVRNHSGYAGQAGQEGDPALAWVQHWIALGFAALEAMVDPQGPYCGGAEPGLADIFLVPQMFNARRFACDLSPYPRLVAIDAACQSLPAFAAAHPSRQPQD